MGGEKEYRERATRTRPRRLFRRVGSIAASNLSFSAKKRDRPFRSVSFFLWLRRGDLNSFCAGYPARAIESERARWAMKRGRNGRRKGVSGARHAYATETTISTSGWYNRFKSLLLRPPKKTPSGAFLSPKSSEALSVPLIKISLCFARTTNGRPYMFW